MDLNHFKLRCKQRGFTVEDEESCRSFGRVVHQGRGRIAYFIGRREVAKDPTLAPFQGCALVETIYGSKVTAIRSEDFSRLRKTSFKQQRRKRRNWAA